jgi:hypothetical protein
MKRRPKEPKGHRSARRKLAKPNAAAKRRRTKHTTAREQDVISGALRISTAQVSRRCASKPLEAKANQKPADHGLILDENKQINFIDLTTQRPQVESTIASVSFMITQQQKEMLRGLGYTEEQIWKMTPEGAHMILRERIKAS